MSPYSVDDIRNAYRRGELTYAAALDALNRMQATGPGKLLTHPIAVSPSPLLATRRPM